MVAITSYFHFFHRFFCNIYINFIWAIFMYPERCFSYKCLVDDLEYFLSQALRLQRYTYINKHSVQCYEQSCRLWCNILLLSKLLWCCVTLVDAQMVLHQTKPATIQAGLFSFQSINRFLLTIPIKRDETVLPCMSLIGCSKFR